MTSHEVLGLAPDATRDQVRAAFLGRVRLLHPDRFTAAAADQRAQAACGWRALHEAYRALMRATSPAPVRLYAPASRPRSAIYPDRRARGHLLDVTH